jgi:hypothetical protein
VAATSSPATTVRSGRAVLFIGVFRIPFIPIIPSRATCV